MFEITFIIWFCFWQKLKTRKILRVLLEIRVIVHYKYKYKYIYIYAQENTILLSNQYLVK